MAYDYQKPELDFTLQKMEVIPMKRNLNRIIILALILCLASPFSMAAPKKIRIGMSVLELANPFFVALSEGAKKYAADHGAILTVNDPKNDPNAQISAIENFTASKMDAIIITATDPKAIFPAIQKARAAGVKVIAHTAKLDEYDAWVAADEHDMGLALGLQAGKWIKEKLNGKAEVGILNYRSIPQVINREKGIEDGIHQFAPDAKVVASAQAGSPQDGMKVTENFLQAHPDIKVICGINDGGALGALEAVKAAGKASNDFFIGGIDATDEAISKIKEGGIYRATVDQNPSGMGEKCVELALKSISGKKFDKDYAVKLVQVNASNVKEYPKKK
jgi:ribose transport system substrate-binding protein